jgi:pimeloyl-ACP methyl ester carboxylesterase
VFDVVTQKFHTPDPGTVAANTFFLYRRMWGPRSLLVFVHGLGGSPYETWRKFPDLVFSDPDLYHFDVGLFRYDSSVFRWNMLKLAPARPIDDIGAELADILRDDLREYQNVVFICHSLGGIVTKFAIRRIIEFYPANTDRLRLLVLIGTPNYGSLLASWIPAPILVPFSRDIASLRVFSPELESLQLFWNTRVRHNPKDAADRVLVNTRAIVSAKDRFVRRGSGIGSLPDQYLRRVPVAHTRLVKPADTGDSVYRYVKQSILDVVPAAGSAIRPRRHLAFELNDVVSTFFLEMRRMGELYREKQAAIKEGRFESGSRFDTVYQEQQKIVNEAFARVRDSLRRVWEHFPDGDVRARVSEFANWYHSVVDADEDIDPRPSGAGPQRLRGIVDAMYAQSPEER